MFQKKTCFIMAAATLCLLTLPLYQRSHRDLAADAYESTFEQLKTPDVMTHRTLQKELIRTRFLADPGSGVPFVLNKLWAKPSSHSFLQRQSREMDLCVARAILAEMPVSIQEELASLRTRTPLRKARLLEAMGGFKTPLALEKLSAALGDQRISGLNYALYDGWPLRVCDIAYNTLTLRLQPEDFRSPLGINHSYSQRDGWIQKLENWLKENREDALQGFSSYPSE